MNGKRRSWALCLNAGLLGLLLASDAGAYELDENAQVATTDGSAADVQAAIDDAAVGDGWTVTLPAGTFHWSESVRVSGKGIRLRGAGAGGFVGRSRSELTVGTGTRSLLVGSGVSLQVGQQVRLLYTANDDHSMEGAVASYDGEALNVEVTSVTGSGTYDLWTVAVPALTELVNDVPAVTEPNGSVSGWSTAMIYLDEDTSHHVELSGIHFVGGTAETASTEEERGTNHVKLYLVDGGQPILLYGNWFSAAGAMGRSLGVHATRGVIFGNSFDNGLCGSDYVGCSPEITQAMVLVNDHDDLSWESASTLGADDATGTSNIYVEDNTFVGFWQSAIDADSNSRSVIRHNVFDQTAIGTHGAETSPDGVRHYEIYANRVLFDDRGDETYQLPWWFYVRGGTGVIFDNELDDISSSAWGDKAEIVMTQQSLRRDTGEPWGCWSEGYPHPRQVGQSWSNGGYVTDPLYIWGNDIEPAVGLSNYEPNECGDGAPSIEEFIQLGRDYVLGPKDGYEPYPYPHPLRQDAPLPDGGLPDAGSGGSGGAGSSDAANDDEGGCGCRLASPRPAAPLGLTVLLVLGLGRPRRRRT